MSPAQRSPWLVIGGFIALAIFVALCVPSDLAYLDQRALVRDAGSFAQTACADLDYDAEAHGKTGLGPIIRCTYYVGGTAYHTDNQLGPTLPNAGSHELAEQAGREYAERHRLYAFYDPAQPSRAVMTRTPAPNDLVMVILGNVAVFGAIAWAAVRLWRRR